MPLKPAPGHPDNPGASAGAPAPLQTPCLRLAIMLACLKMHSSHFRTSEFAISNRYGQVVQLKPSQSQFILDSSHYTVPVNANSGIYFTVTFSLLCSSVQSKKSPSGMVKECQCRTEVLFVIFFFLIK